MSIFRFSKNDDRNGVSPSPTGSRCADDLRAIHTKRRLSTEVLGSDRDRNEGRETRARGRREFTLMIARREIGLSVIDRREKESESGSGCAIIAQGRSSPRREVAILSINSKAIFPRGSAAY